MRKYNFKQLRDELKSYHPIIGEILNKSFSQLTDEDIEILMDWNLKVSKLSELTSTECDYLIVKMTRVNSVIRQYYSSCLTRANKE